MMGTLCNAYLKSHASNYAHLWTLHEGWWGGKAEWNTRIWNIKKVEEGQVTFQVLGICQENAGNVIFIEQLPGNNKI